MSEPQMSAAASTLASKPYRRARRIRSILVATLVLFWLVAFAGTHVPVSRELVERSGGDKSLHFWGYAILGSLLMGLRASGGTFGKKSVFIRLLILVTYAAVDEFTQSFVGRHADVADWYADSLGALCGIAFVVLLVQVLSWRRVVAEGNHEKNAAD